MKLTSILLVAALCVATTFACTACTYPFPIVQRNISSTIIADAKRCFDNGGYKDYISAIPTFHLTQTSSVEVTFIMETATWTNQLGYFLTDASNTAVNSPTLFWRNIKPDCLKARDTVVLGPFPAGTYLGFYLIANGDCGGTKKLYSAPSLNANGHVATVAFYDGTREEVTFGYEDGGGDDYSDVLFNVATPNGVFFETTNFNTLCTSGTTSSASRFQPILWVSLLVLTFMLLLK